MAIFATNACEAIWWLREAHIFYGNTLLFGDFAFVLWVFDGGILLFLTVFRVVEYYIAVFWIFMVTSVISRLCLSALVF